MPQLRVLPTDVLMPDPDVQLAFTLEKKRVAEMQALFNPDYVVVLVVVPLNGKYTGMYGIVDGRHRFLAGRDRLAEWRCDVHTDVHTVQQKAALKLAIDRQRRRVRPIEHFLERLKMEDPTAVAINGLVTEVDFEIGKLSGGKPYTRFEGVQTLEMIYSILGADGLHRTLVLNTNWRGEPKTNSALWLRSLGLLARDGYDEAITPRALKRWQDVIPAREIRKAQGEVESLGSGMGNQDTWGAMPYVLATALRKRGGLRVRPAQQRQKGHRSRPI